jgi:hypothetical protein
VDLRPSRDLPESIEGSAAEGTVVAHTSMYSQFSLVRFSSVALTSKTAYQLMFK